MAALPTATPPRCQRAQPATAAATSPRVATRAVRVHRQRQYHCRTPHGRTGCVCVCVRVCVCESTAVHLTCACRPARFAPCSPASPATLHLPRGCCAPTTPTTPTTPATHAPLTHRVHIYNTTTQSRTPHAPLTHAPLTPAAPLTNARTPLWHHTGTDNFLFMERPSGRHPDGSHNIAGFLNLPTRAWTHLYSPDGWVRKQGNGGRGGEGSCARAGRNRSR